MTPATQRTRQVPATRLRWFKVYNNTDDVAYFQAMTFVTHGDPATPEQSIVFYGDDGATTCVFTPGSWTHVVAAPDRQETVNTYTKTKGCED